MALSNTELQLYTAQRLIERGFKDWFLYFFQLIEKTPFQIDLIHEEIFETFIDCFNLNKKRCIVNVPPRSGKTTMATYFVAFSLAQNPKSNFIYTSYSQTLLSDVSRKLKEILEYPVFKMAYNNSITVDEIQTNPLDDYWRDYLKKDNEKDMYSSTRIRTSQGGTVLLCSVGATITGFGCGIRNASKFSGALIVDDANKPDDVRYAIKRSRVHTYYSMTLLSRLNNSNVPIINIQQRLHIEDLTGFLIEKYQFFVLVKPLLLNGICQIRSQYTDERIKELKVDGRVFESQYQQIPCPEEGSIIKDVWLNNTIKTEVMQQMTFDSIYLSCDTAFKDKEHNDPSAILVFGMLKNKAYLLYVSTKRLIYPELKKEIEIIATKYKPKAILIEDKASGQSVIQELKTSVKGYNIIPIKPNGDKLQRLSSASVFIEAGRLILPEEESWLFEYRNQLLSFPNTKHDDMVDATSQFINWLVEKERMRKAGTITSIFSMALDIKDR